MEPEVIAKKLQDFWQERLTRYSELKSIYLRDKNMKPEVRAKKLQDIWWEHVTKFSELRSIYLRDGHKNMEPEGVSKKFWNRRWRQKKMLSILSSINLPMEKVLASRILFSSDVQRIENLLDELEEKGPKGMALAMLRRSERLLFTDGYHKDMMPLTYKNLMMIYRRRGEKQDLRRLWNLAKENTTLFDAEQYIFTIWAFLEKEDIEGVHEVLEDWNSTGDIRKLVVYGDQRKLMMKATEKMVNDMVKDHNEEEENKKKKRAMEVRRNGWNPKKDLVLSAYACVQYVGGRRDIESAADVLRLFGKQEPQHVMDSDSDGLSRKMVEAMRGGGYFGGV